MDKEQRKNFPYPVPLSQIVTEGQFKRGAPDKAYILIFTSVYEGDF